MRKMNRISELRKLSQLRRSNNEALEARKDKQEAIARKTSGAFWNSEWQCWEYPQGRFDGLHDND